MVSFVTPHVGKDRLHDRPARAIDLPGCRRSIFTRIFWLKVSGVFK
jgi:hypothetical protein